MPTRLLAATAHLCHTLTAEQLSRVDPYELFELDSCFIAAIADTGFACILNDSDRFVFGFRGGGGGLAADGAYRLFCQVRSPGVVGIADVANKRFFLVTSHTDCLFNRLFRTKQFKSNDSVPALNTPAIAFSKYIT